ncbi:MAG: hypothetical protein K9G48_08695 [Reyranella sp.]|nr:hypothetical protein [Reyranella sp.]
MIDWQPMETVPTDRPILIYCEGGFGYQIVNWNDDDKEWRAESREGLNENWPPLCWADLTKPDPVPVKRPTVEEVRKPWQDRIDSGKPMVTYVLEPPMTISKSPQNTVIIDAPFELAGFDKAGIQRVLVALTPPILRFALQAIDEGKGPITVKKQAQA